MKLRTVVKLNAGAATLLMLIVITTAGLTTTIFAQQNSMYFSANLSGSNEVPPVTTAGSGIATFQLVPVGHQQIMSYQLQLTHMNGVMGAHIHSGKQGENGPIVATLFSTRPPTGVINGLLKTGTVTSSNLTGPLAGQLSLSDLVNMIRSGEAYVNVHTTHNQNGEVRGQIS